MPVFFGAPDPVVNIQFQKVRKTNLISLAIELPNDNGSKITEFAVTLL